MPVFWLALLLVGAGSLYAWKHLAANETAPARFVLEAARADLGVVETSANSGPVVDKYLRDVGISPPANWCAAAVSAWLKTGYAKLGRNPPMQLSARAKGFISEFERLGRWIPRDKLQRVQSLIPPGSVVIWSRGDPAAWTGHIGIFERQSGATFETIEGNSGPRGDRVARMTRRFDDPRLLGVGIP